MVATIRVLAVLLLAAGFACSGPAARPPVAPADPAGAIVLVATDDDGLAVGGHDPIAYTTDGAPVPGSDQHTAQHDGATYRFATAEHQATFEADPARHAPAYGGYCAYAASQDRLTPADPEVWQVLDGHLLLFANQDFHDLFNEDPAGHKQDADRNWPGLVARHGTPLP